MLLAVILGIFIYKIYGHYFPEVVFSSSFAATLVGMTVLSCMLTLAISSNIVISLGMVGVVYRPVSYCDRAIHGSFVSVLVYFCRNQCWEPDCMCWRLPRCLLWWL